jgi:uncharacterized protein
MPEFSSPVTGTFCWVELQTKDPAAAQKFYSALMGWSFEDLPVPGGRYTVARAGGKQVGGVTPLPAPFASAGVPSNWGVYVAVEDVPASTEAAVRLGARLLLGPQSLGPGTFSVLADPTGAMFMLWHTTEPIGTFLYGEIGALCWNELVSTNTDLAQRFYSQLFGWRAEPMPVPGGTYVVFKQNDKSIGGLMPQPEEMKGPPSAWASYFAVTDADATFASALKLGAKVIMPLVDLPDVGRFAWLRDPQGATFAVIKNAMSG